MFNQNKLKKQCVAALFLSVFLGAITCISTSVIAQDIHQQQGEFNVNFTITPQVLTQLSAIDSRQQLADAAFVYDPLIESFDLKLYLENNAPDLVVSYELISHWSGYYSINPKVILAFMKYASTAISLQFSSEHESADDFLQLHDKADFAQTLQQQVKRLSAYFYAYKQLSLQQLSLQKIALGQKNEADSLVFAKNSVNTLRKTSTKATAGTAAILSLIQQKSSINQDDTELEVHYQGFLAVYGQLFGETALAEALRSDLPQQGMKTPDINISFVPPTDMMQMPWREGYTWIANGAHSHTGSGYPLSSIDVSYNWPNWGAQTYSVAAANSGWVKVFSACQVRVTNASGWATNYYHLANIEVSDGQWVEQNTKLGLYASNKSNALCQGGSSTGPHLHFSLLYNGAYRSLQDVNIGPYDINVGNYNYDNNCSRFWLWNTVDQVYKCAWDKLYNPGS